MRKILCGDFEKSFLKWEKMASRKVFRHFLHANFFMFILLISNHAVFLVQFGINLYLRVFQKAEIAFAEAARAISAFWKTHSSKLIPNWTRNGMITYTNFEEQEAFCWHLLAFCWGLLVFISICKCFITFCWCQWLAFLKIIFQQLGPPGMSWYVLLRLVVLLGPFYHWTVSDFGCWVSRLSNSQRSSLHNYGLLHVFQLFHWNSSFSVTGVWVLCGSGGLWLSCRECLPCGWSYIMGWGYRACVGCVFPGHLHVTSSCNKCC